MLVEQILVQATFSSFTRNLYNMARWIPVFGSLLEAMVHRMLPYGTRFWVKAPVGAGDGSWLLLDPRYEVNYWGGRHEPLIQHCLREKLRRGDVLYDVGAHIGFFSLLSAPLVGSEGVVFAFEPDPDNFHRLQQHVSRNGVPQIQPISAAVWSGNGRVGFERAIALSSRNTGAVISPGKIPPAGRMDVPAVSVDEFVKSHPVPTMLKIDVEGGEIEVLRGALQVLRRWHPLILCEIHSPKNLGTFQAMLASLGYVMHRLSDTKSAFPVHYLAEGRSAREQR